MIHRHKGDRVSKLQLRIFDGSRQLFGASAQFLVTITDGNRTQHIRNFYPNNDITFDLPFFDNFGDDYTVVVWANGYKQAGFSPVVLSDQYLKTLDIMLVSNDPGFSFVDAPWDVVKDRYPFLGSDVDNAAGAARYGNLLDQTEESLACLLNICEDMSQISLSQGTPLEYIKQLCWDAPYAPAQDRFFAWCDSRLIDQVKSAAEAGQFAVENNPGLFHPGALQAGSRSNSAKRTSNSLSTRTTRWSSVVSIALWWSPTSITIKTLPLTSFLKLFRTHLDTPSRTQLKSMSFAG
jgi:hypothetical protein